MNDFTERLGEDLRFFDENPQISPNVPGRFNTIIKAATLYHKLAPLLDAGGKVMPKEPTEEMYDAADLELPPDHKDEDGISFDMFCEIYRAMFAAAPSTDGKGG